MNIIKLNHDNFVSTIEQSAEIIQRGGLVIAPFDTIYGIIASPFDDKVLEKIFIIKQRPPEKTIGIAVDSLSSAMNFAQVSESQKQFINDRIPGRFTFILKTNPNTLSEYCLRDNTVGVRIPDSDLILSIARSSGGIIAQTSINRSGQPNCYSIDDIISQFSAEELSHIDLIIDGGELDREGSPSALWDLSKDSPREIKREIPKKD
ncbi:MAG: L-threonylcarbamoyladenylate synthase [bacterium]